MEVVPTHQVELFGPAGAGFGKDADLLDDLEFDVGHFLGLHYFISQPPLAFSNITYRFSLVCKPFENHRKFSLLFYS